MKKLIFGFIATVSLVTNSFCQTNNPQNAFGRDVADAFYLISKDFQDGKIKDLNQGTLDYYFGVALSDYPKVKLEEFNKVFNLLKESDNQSIIANSGFSQEGKKFLEKSLTNYSITTLVDEVKRSKISDAEKENIFAVLAINYNLYKPLSAEKSTIKINGKGPNANFELNENLLVYSTADRGTTAIWGALGFILGNAICGLPCGILGGIIGLVLGGYSNDTGGGGTTSSGSWVPSP